MCESSVLLHEMNACMFSTVHFIFFTNIISSLAVAFHFILIEFQCLNNIAFKLYIFL